ncbi:MAG TPA: hypothetical protein DEB39_15990, partial [Planctomycetaceae bacterium]|nr:hypothetical protein [Planctomycetaceae bacterium]
TPCPERCRPVADAEGITKSTLRDASCELGIRKIKETFSKRWMWSLPTDEATSEPAFSEFTDSGGEGRQGRGGAEPPDQRDRQETSGSTPQLCERLFAPSPDDLDAWRRILAEDPTLEPAIRGTADGMAPGLVADRLRIIGNGVVPMVVAYAFVLLAAAHVARNEASG